MIVHRKSFVICSAFSWLCWRYCLFSHHPISTIIMKIRLINMIGRVVEIVGIQIGDRGHSCKEHIAHCGVVLAPDVLVCLLVEETMVDGCLEQAICVCWQTQLSAAGLDFFPVTWFAMQKVQMACWLKSLKFMMRPTTARPFARRFIEIMAFAMQQS